MKLAGVKAISSLIFLLAGCSDVTTPVEQLSCAESARLLHDYGKALALYDGLLSWQGEGEVQPDDQFRAALDSVECLIALGRPAVGIDRYRKIHDDFPTEMRQPDAYRHTLAVFDALLAHAAGARLPHDFLILVASQHRDDSSRFDAWVLRCFELGVFDIPSREDHRPSVIGGSDWPDSDWPDAWLFPDCRPPPTLFDDEK